MSTSTGNAPLGRMILALGLITVLAAALLAAVNNATAGAKEHAAAQARRDAIAEVSPQFDNDPEAGAIERADGLTIYPIERNGVPVGYAVITFSDSGFSDRITMMVGFDIVGNVTGYRVLSHSETPGLGAKMDTWFQPDQGASRSVVGLHGGDLRVSKDGGEVDAITGATITSRAFLEAINNAYKALPE